MKMKNKLINIINRKKEERIIFNIFVNRRYKAGNGKVVFRRGVKLKTERGGHFEIPKGLASFGEKHWSIDVRKTMICLGKNGRMVCNGDVYIYAGNCISVGDNAVLEIGSGSYINVCSEIDCFYKISIGQGTVISSHVSIRDSDNHVIDGKTDEVTKTVTIGNHVWIGMNVTILKGVTIGDGAVIGAGSIVTKDVPPRCLAAGNPCKIIRTNIEWKL